MKKEIPLKQWKYEEAERRKLAFGTVQNYLSRGRIKYPPVRRVNKCVVFVKV